MAVIGVMAVLLIITLTVTSSSLQALTITTSTRAGVQAQAAAEAGIAVALASLQNIGAVCPSGGVIASEGDSVPAYRVEVSTLTDEWSPSCPTGAVDETKVRIVSQGESTAGTVNHARTVEEIYDITPSGATNNLGSVITSSEDLDVDGWSVTTGEPTDIRVLNGDFACSKNGTVQADLRVAGNVTTGPSQSCSVDGNVDALGNIVVWNHVAVSGNVHGNDSIEVKSNGLVSGDLTNSSDDQTLIQGKVTGDVVLAGTLYKSSQADIGGRLSQNVSDVPRPQTAQAGDWVAFHYDLEDFRDAGFELLSGDCWINRDSWENLTVPTVVDLRRCDAVDLDKLTLEVRTDIAFILPDTQIDELDLESHNGDRHKIWFLIPEDDWNNGDDWHDDSNQRHDDDDDDDECDADFTIGDKAKISGEISVMVYTPCEIELNDVQWRGQLYAGKVDIDDDDSRIHFVPMGIPGTELFPAAVNDSVGPSTDWTLLSSRNRSKVPK
ncbi:polymer-forming cytoskeletal protein [Cryobacterium sp. Y50]|uniref:polymer-forming cytoskeletal protein n=1 Tax=Cryobacterium sp. Y50 TaxID=2048286 RepID=UPI000CE3C9D9|nr:polymer-forming cytoskeletal protein [Cryobacterium sp. Y50]